jgi:hypothetical protein
VTAHVSLREASHHRMIKKSYLVFAEPKPVNREKWSLIYSGLLVYQPWRKSFREVMKFHEIFHEKTFRQSFMKFHEKFHKRFHEIS